MFQLKKEVPKINDGFCLIEATVHIYFACLFVLLAELKI